MKENKTKEIKLSIIEAGEKAVKQLIKVAKEDIIKELKIQVEMGGEWNTPEEKSRADRLLRKDSWGSITKSMERWENDVDRANKGLSPRINWQSKDW